MKRVEQKKDIVVREEERNSKIVSSENGVLNTKYDEIMLEIDNKEGLDAVERLEEKMTLQSIYSFAEEIAQDNSSMYDPKWIEWIRDDRKFAGDNPDTQYFTAFIDPQADYMLSGTMKDLVFLEITSYRKEKGVNKISGSTILKNDGAYSITLSMDKKQNPEVLLHEDDYILMLRYYRKEPTPQKMDISIQTIKEPAQKKEVNPDFRLKLALDLFESLYHSSNFLTAQFSKQPNAYADEIEVTNEYARNLFPNTSVVYDGAFIDISDDQYLVIKGEIDIKQYFIFVFYNSLWTTPYTNDVQSFNLNTLKTDTDGKYEIVISSQPMDVDNNIVLGELRKGIFSMRTTDDDFDRPTIEVKKESTT